MRRKTNADKFSIFGIPVCYRHFMLARFSLVDLYPLKVSISYSLIASSNSCSY